MWKTFPNLTRFEVSDKGEVRNRETGKLLKQFTNKKGYKVIATKIGGRKGKNVCYRVHRMVAETYLDNQENFPVVNHLDGDKTNNSVDNLEWCSHSRNLKHSYDTKLREPTCQKDVQTLTEDQVQRLLSEFKLGCKRYGARAFGREFGLDKSSILKLVRNGGYLT